MTLHSDVDVVLLRKQPSFLQSHSSRSHRNHVHRMSFNRKSTAIAIQAVLTPLARMLVLWEWTVVPMMAVSIFAQASIVAVRHACDMRKTSQLISSELDAVLMETFGLFTLPAKIMHIAELHRLELFHQISFEGRERWVKTLTVLVASDLWLHKLHFVSFNVSRDRLRSRDRCHGGPSLWFSLKISDAARGSSSRRSRHSGVSDEMVRVDVIGCHAGSVTEDGGKTCSLQRQN